jgi:hypothetical protein
VSLLFDCRLTDVPGKTERGGKGQEETQKIKCERKTGRERNSEKG